MIERGGEENTVEDVRAEGQVFTEALDELELAAEGAAQGIDAHERSRSLARVQRLRLRAASYVENKSLQTGESAKCLGHLALGDGEVVFRVRLVAREAVALDLLPKRPAGDDVTVG